MKRPQAQTKQEILKLLKDHRAELQTEFKATQLALFGSWVHGDQKRGSDIDILVDFEPDEKTFANYMNLKFHLESLLGRKVDLVTFSGLRKEIREEVLSEAAYV